MTDNVFYQETQLSSRERKELTNRNGMTLWMTGLSGSGKSTIAALVEKKLLEKGIRSYLLDGDNLRLGLNADLGFSDKDRTENIRRLSHIAGLFSESGTAVITGAISPFRKDREEARRICSAKGAFTEIYVNTPLSECMKRDVKGLYRKAVAGEIRNFTGIDSPYEPPEAPELILDTLTQSPEEAADIVVNYVETLTRLHDLLPPLIELTKKAGEAILEIYGKEDFEVSYKEDHSPLTAADLASNDILCRGLKELCPDIPVLSEETKDSDERLNCPLCFVVDPLDGTKEFLKRNGEFTVNIGLSLYGNSVLGVIGVPVTGEVYAAAKGEGCFLYTKDGKSKPLHVSDKTEAVTLMASRSHSDEATQQLIERNREKIGDFLSKGSSLKGCLIAEGKAEVYYRTGYTMEWDTAAMQCIVEEAGGIFRQLDGSPMRYNRKNSLNEKGFYILNRIENKFQ